VGIYDKTCPQCMASSSAATARCTCGYLFDASVSDERSLTLERIAREEKLFEEYLEARLAQAQEAAIVAAHAAELDPENQRKAVEALRTKQAAEKAAAGLAAQRIKAAQAAHAAGVSFAMRGSLMPDGAWNAKPLSTVSSGEVARPTTPVNGATVSHAVAPPASERWTPEYDSKRTMPPLRTNAAAPHTQTGTSKFAAAAGGTVSMPLAFSSTDRVHGGKPPIPVLTTEVPRQSLAPVPVYHSGSKVFESKMVFNGSPWRDAAKKIAAKAARQVASAAARSAKKAAKGIGHAAAHGAKKAGRVAARGASKVAKRVTNAAAQTAKKAARAVRQRRQAMNIRQTRTTPTFNPPPIAIEPATANRRDTSPKAAVNTGARRTVTNKPPIKPASTPKSMPVTTAASTTPEQAQSRGPAPLPPAKSVPAITRLVAPRQRPQPTEGFRAMQAAKIERAVNAARQLERTPPTMEIECALCSASLPANAERCLCGWRVPNHEREIPALEAGTGKPNVGNGNELTVVFCPIECPLCTATIAANARRCQCGWRVPEGVNELPPVALSNDEISALAHNAQLVELDKAR
jgi:hypothetical protein